MSERVIQQADLRIIEKNLKMLAESVDAANYNVQAVNSKVEQVDNRLDTLFNQFKDFLEADMKAKELQLAETRLVKVRQELENKYGHYEEVRKHTTGILQAVDTGVVRKETITTSTEELMIKTPGYWLAPCLIAISAWICDDKNLAEKALDEAIRRDDEKTSLFFALVNRRIGRYEASEAWIKRYFSMQDPHRLEREIIVVLDAYANGMFGGDTSGECSEKIQSWLKELSEKNGFVEEQRQNWKKALRLKQDTVDTKDYTYLRQYSKDWDNIEMSLNSATLHDNLLNYLKGIFEGEIYVSPNVKIALDELLTKLVTDFDKEELPLRKQEDYLHAVIESSGDKNLAASKTELSEKAYEEYVNFTQLLTNASMFQNGTHSSKATQRLATALSKAWIIEAYGDITAEGRLNVPANINIALDDWSGITQDGSNEGQLTEEFKNHCDRKQAEELANVKIKKGSYVKLAIGTILGLAFVGTIVLAVVIWAIFGFLFYRDYKKVNVLKAEIPRKYGEYKDNGIQIIKALLAEVVDFRRQYESKDKKFEDTKAYIEGISHKQFIYNNYSTARNVIV